MRILLVGSKSFGAAVFDVIVRQGHRVVGVWSPQDLDDVLSSQPLDPVWQHPLVRTPNRVRDMKVDLLVAAHNHDFIPRGVLEATRLGGISFHPSLLPRHRGRDAVRWTIHMGDSIAGGTVYWLDDHVDGGPIAAQEHCFVRREDDASSLWRRELFPMGVRLLAQVLRDLERGVVIKRYQDEQVATWEPSFDRPRMSQDG